MTYSKISDFSGWGTTIKLSIKGITEIAWSVVQYINYVIKSYIGYERCWGEIWRVANEEDEFNVEQFRSFICRLSGGVPCIECTSLVFSGRRGSKLLFFRALWGSEAHAEKVGVACFASVRLDFLALEEVFLEFRTVDVDPTSSHVPRICLWSLSFD